MNNITNFISEKLQKINSKTASFSYDNDIVDSYSMSEFVNYINQNYRFNHFDSEQIYNKYPRKKYLFNLIDNEKLNDIAKEELNKLKAADKDYKTLSNYVDKILRLRKIYQGGILSGTNDPRILIKYKSGEDNFIFGLDANNNKFNVFQIIEK